MEVARDCWNACRSSVVTARRFALVPRFLETGASPVVYQSLSPSALIDPWGVVRPCITEDRSLGRLQEHDGSLAELWRTPRRRRLDPL